MSPLPAITVQDLHAKITAGDYFQLIDVREPDEYAQAAISGSTLIPLASIPARIAEINPASAVIIHCKAGGRSARAAQFLLENGYNDVTNVTGGMDAWLDAALPTSQE
jgi:adenylyltransferase/sulfurtransferase